LTDQQGSSPGEEARQQSPLGVFLRGIAMGAADIVPGVSGGTIAFITGIYFRLLAAINALPPAAIRELARGRIAAFWTAIDGTFLVSLLAGILASILTLASLISQALTDYPILLWSFFFGLIVASVWHVGRQIRELRGMLLVPLTAGAVFAWWITTLSAGQVELTPWLFLGSGALAICAMILPGISGSFILVVIGMYGPVLDAIRNLELGSLGLFMAGCAIGLLSIARLISWAFHRYHDPVMALLTGLMVGALNKVWPWKQTLSWRTNSAGEQVPLNEVSISPVHYAEITGLSSDWLMALVAAVLGFGLVLAVEWLASGPLAPAKRHS